MLAELSNELKCDFCGIALFPQELAFEFSGRAVDFIEKRQLQGSFCLCSGCRDKVIQYSNETMKEAQARRKKLFGGGK